MILFLTRSPYIRMGLLKNWWHGCPAHALWPKKYMGETPMPPYSKHPNPCREARIFLRLGTFMLDSVLLKAVRARLIISLNGM